jgi:4'-phosphopantetheinyl transferase EntD
VAIFFQHSINDSTALGIWRIEEPEIFFLEKVPLKYEVSHPYKRLQHLAGRYLLPFLFDDFPLEEIAIADTRKPFLADEKYHFSISHCGNYAAAIASTHNRVGIDIELVTPAIEKVSAKFLNEAEKRVVAEWQHLPHLYHQLLTIIWSAKEAIFKWHGAGQVNFKNHLLMQGDRITIKPDESICLPFLFSREQSIPLKVNVQLFDDLVLTWVASETGSRNNSTARL